MNVKQVRDKIRGLSNPEGINQYTKREGVTKSREEERGNVAGSTTYSGVGGRHTIHDREPNTVIHRDMPGLAPGHLGMTDHASSAEAHAFAAKVAGSSSALKDVTQKYQRESVSPSERLGFPTKTKTGKGGGTMDQR